MLRHHQGSGWGNPEIHGWTMSRARETAQHSALNGMSPSNPSPQGPGKPSEEEAERLWEPEGMEDAKETRPSRHIRTDTHMNSEPVAACTGPAWVQTR